MSKPSPTSTKILEHLAFERGGLLTRHDVLNAGLHPRVLAQAVENGTLERVQRGIYLAPNAPLYNHAELHELGLRVPGAVVCLNSALSFHGLTTTQPLEISLAINRRARAPKIEFPPVRFYRFSEASYQYGIENISEARESYSIAVYSPEKTLADLLKYRHKIGLDVFLEGLALYFRKRKPDIHALHEAARVCQVEPLMRTYTQLLSVDTET
jgi:predicted transcriptional regulator of viral defense system